VRIGFLKKFHVNSLEYGDRSMPISFQIAESAISRTSSGASLLQKGEPSGAVSASGGFVRFLGIVHWIIESLTSPTISGSVTRA
jgi:hypothetical protein